MRYAIGIVLTALVLSGCQKEEEAPLPPRPVLSVVVEPATLPGTRFAGTVQAKVQAALGFRVGGLAYLPDVSAIPDEAWPAVEGLDVWVLDALRRKPHPTHTHLAQSLDWIARAAPRRAVLTNMHNDLDYATLAAELPAGVAPAYDGMTIEIGP